MRIKEHDKSAQQVLLLFPSLFSIFYNVFEGQQSQKMLVSVTTAKVVPQTNTLQIHLGHIGLTVEYPFLLQNFLKLFTSAL